MYMPGRLRTASRPLRTLMDSAPYSPAARRPFDCVGVHVGHTVSRIARPEPSTRTPWARPEQVFEQVLVRSGQEGLEAQRHDFVEQRGPPAAVQMRGDFVQQQYRVWRRFCTRKTRRLGQNEVQNQSFLLAGGAFRRRTVLFGVN